ncbi:1409_t:CDS:2 [Entrophospora sp. SA101]|nr:1409_t:CDS:2 [Entrophospora sp. SA101]CAJ0842016.1 10714_t:CDS:2 [Entrophospora sp. SA101]
MTNISTERLYYTDTYLDKLEIKILEIGQDDNGSYVIFDKTIFHPQGGGQPNDEGCLEIAGQRYAVKKLGDKVIQTIDRAKRLLYSRLHSAGHLLEDAVNQLFPSLKGIRANHFPNGQAFVVFAGEIPVDIQANKEKISNLANELIKRNLAIKVEYNGQIRTVIIGDFAAHACGGTHVKNTSEIKEIVVRSIKKDKDNKIGGGFLIIKNSSTKTNDFSKPPEEQRKPTPPQDNPLPDRPNNPPQLPQPKPNPVNNDKTELKDFTLSYSENEVVKKIAKTGLFDNQLTLLERNFTLTPDSPLKNDPDFLERFKAKSKDVYFDYSQHTGGDYVFIDNQIQGGKSEKDCDKCVFSPDILRSKNYWLKTTYKINLNGLIKSLKYLI